jgi:hypothetical protein
VNTLFLTAEEQKVFQALPAKLREGWTVEEEKGQFQDAEEKLSMRMALLRLHDPKLLAVQKRAVGLSSGQLAELLAQTDLKGVADDDLAELTFAVGPSILSKLIEGLLLQAKTDAELEDIVALALIRHSLLQSYISV